MGEPIQGSWTPSGLIWSCKEGRNWGWAGGRPPNPDPSPPCTSERRMVAQGSCVDGVCRAEQGAQVPGLALLHTHCAVGNSTLPLSLGPRSPRGEWGCAQTPAGWDTPSPDSPA